MEFSELFTQSARRLLPLARRRQLVSYFDYSGPYLSLHADAGLQAGLHRVMLAALDCMASGFVMFQAEVEEAVGDRRAVMVHAAATGAPASRSEIEAVLQRLGMQRLRLGSGGSSTREIHAQGRCPACGAEVEFVDAGRDGRVFSMRLVVRGSPITGATPLPEAAGTLAWLVAAIPGALNSVERRLRRLGWRTVSLKSMDRVTALDALAGGESPMLLVVAESTGSERQEMQRVAEAFPAMWLVLAVMAGSPSLQARDLSRVDIRELPMSPMELEDFTEHFDVRTSTLESRSTAPAPVYLQPPATLLIVDDNAVNLMIARALLESLGYDVEVASDGAQALAACYRQAPAAVLMDVHMPVMDGLEATRELRAAQRVGSLPPFPIVAATTASDDQTMTECMEAGMDGFLAKPLSPRTLADELHRVLPAQALPHRH